MHAQYRQATQAQLAADTGRAQMPRKAGIQARVRRPDGEKVLSIGVSWPETRKAQTE